MKSPSALPLPFAALAETWKITGPPRSGAVQSTVHFAASPEASAAPAFRCPAYWIGPDVSTPIRSPSPDPGASVPACPVPSSNRAASWNPAIFIPGRLTTTVRV
jgi:hypothetical protein